MAIGYVLVKRGKPNQPTSVKRWYAQTESINEVNFNMVCEEAQYACSATKGDVMLVLDACLATITRHLAQGEDVSLGEFGRFRTTVTNKKSYWDAEAEERIYPAPTVRADFDPVYNITKCAVRFTPGRSLRNMCHSATYRELDYGRGTQSSSNENENENEIPTDKECSCEKGSRTIRGEKKRQKEGGEEKNN